MKWAQLETGTSKSIRDNARGFTIVELLIVIVVIAILAAISVVAYTGIQQRASFAAMQQDLSSIRKALLLYKAERGSYPSTNDAWFGRDQAQGNDFIPGLSPTYIQQIPQLDPSLHRDDSYLYRSTGSDYVLIRFRGTAAGGLPSHERDGNNRIWYANQNEGWGYWSSGYSADRPSD